MIALGLEAVLVSDVDHGVGDTIVTNVAVLTTDSDSFVLSTGVDQLTVFLMLNAVGCLVPVQQNIDISTKHEELNLIHFIPSILTGI